MPGKDRQLVRRPPMSHTVVFLKTTRAMQQSRLLRRTNVFPEAYTTLWDNLRVVRTLLS